MAAPSGAGEVYAIYLRPKRRGRGDGRALFTTATEDLIERGHDPLVVWVFEANVDTRRFYAAAGFQPDGARSDIDFDGLKDDYGIGIRLHGPQATPIRIDFASGGEGFRINFTSSAVF